MSTPGPSTLPRRWKGKARRRRSLLAGRDEGSGGTDGIVLPLDMVGTGVYDVAYTIPLQFGSNQQNLSLQVDTGSSDLWVASSTCSSSACDASKGRLYDSGSSSTATQTGQSFKIDYLQGEVSGPIVWDTVAVGGYSIDNQALAAADSVDSEPLGTSYNGILGLALPLNSVIGSTIRPVTNNNPDGATFSSNLFGITPISQAPSAHFFSLVLARPGSDRLPSLLGIGHHPYAVVPDPSKIKYSTVVSDATGTRFWKTNVRGITVWVDGNAKSVALGRSVKGGPFPVAVLDSGVPLILTTSVIANGIYGAIGISPAADGQYYVPCTTPLNISITLDGQGEISLHPLDLTSEPSDNPSSENCVGIIQATDTTFMNPTVNIGDIILGVPFMRNAYTVMAYEIPDTNGGFVNDSSSDDASSNAEIHPRLGLLGLTDPTTAMEEFKTVRLYNQPLPATGGPGGGASSSSGGKKMSVGIDVLIGLVSFFGMCILLFALRWFLTKRKWNREAQTEGGEGGDAKAAFAYQLARRGSQSSFEHPSESTLRTARSNELKKERDVSELTMSSTRTQAENHDVEVEGEFGQMRPLRRETSHNVNDPWDPRNYSMAFRDSVYEPEEVHIPLSPEPAQEVAHRPDHQRTTSELRQNAQSVMVPLLAHTRGESRADDLAEFGLGNMSSMAGVGTAARGSKIDTGIRESSVGSIDSTVSAPSPSPRRSTLTPRGPRPPSSRSQSDSISSENSGHKP